MKLKLTAYKQIAHAFAMRVSTKKAEPDFRRLMAVYVSNTRDSEFNSLVAQLKAFWDKSKYEYSAIYFWIEYDDLS